MRQLVPPVTWTVQMRIPLDARLVRRASKKSLEKVLAAAMVKMFQQIPPEFIVNSAARLKTEAKKADKILIMPGEPLKL